MKVFLEKPVLDKGEKEVQNTDSVKNYTKAATDVNIWDTQEKVQC